MSKFITFQSKSASTNCLSDSSRWKVTGTNSSLKLSEKRTRKRTRRLAGHFRRRMLLLKRRRRSARLKLRLPIVRPSASRSTHPMQNQLKLRIPSPSCDIHYFSEYVRSAFWEGNVYLAFIGYRWFIAWRCRSTDKEVTKVHGHETMNDQDLLYDNLKNPSSTIA